jgi:hypothetical protein
MENKKIEPVKDEAAETMPQQIVRLTGERDAWKNEAIVSRIEKKNLANRNANLASEAAYWQSQTQILAAELEAKSKV